MRNIKKIFAFLIVGIFIFSSMGCKMIKKTDEAIRKSPVAKVDGDKITKEQLDERMIQTKMQFESNYGANWESNTEAKASYVEQEKNMRDQMVSELLILQHAKKEKVLPADKVIDDEFNKKYQEYIKQFGDENKLKDALKQNGFTKDSYTKYYKQQIKVNKAMEGLTKNVTVTDADIQKEYDTNKNTKYTTDAGYMIISHILVATEAEAQTVISRLNKGEDFAKVAGEVSTDTGSKSNGGDLGKYFFDESKNQTPLLPEFVQAAMKLQKGQISTPVKTQYGYHVIKVTDRVEYPAKPFDQVKDTIKQTLTDTKKKEKINSDLEKWKKSLGKKIKNYNKNLD